MLGAYLRSMSADSPWRDPDTRHEALPRDQSELEQVLAKEALKHCTNHALPCPCSEGLSSVLAHWTLRSEVIE